MGDFNSETQYVPGGNSTGYEIMSVHHLTSSQAIDQNFPSTGVRKPVKIDEAFAERYPVESQGFAFANLITAAPPQRVSGNHATFAGFKSVQDPKAVQKEYTQIDFILGGK